MTPAAPEATGLEVDKMNSKHLEYHSMLLLVKF